MHNTRNPKSVALTALLLLLLQASADTCLCPHVLAGTYACNPCGSISPPKSSEAGAARNFLQDMIQAWHSQLLASDICTSGQRYAP
jgi:hypothetical protein